MKTRACMHARVWPVRSHARVYVLMCTCIGTFCVNVLDSRERTKPTTFSSSARYSTEDSGRNAACITSLRGYNKVDKAFMKPLITIASAAFFSKGAAAEMIYLLVPREQRKAYRRPGYDSGANSS